MNIPLIGRTVGKTQGCWNCVHAELDATKVLEIWRTTDRPNRERQIAAAKEQAANAANVDPAAIVRHQSASRNDPCPCGSGAKYKRCHLERDREAATVMNQRVDGIENADRILRNLDGAIGQGLYVLCKNKASGHQYTNHRFQCDQWSGVQGASIARAGAAPDKLPEELKDIHGDGNDN